MNVKMMASFGFFILIYSLLNGYIGWNLFVWMEATFQLNTLWPLVVLMIFLSYAYLFGQVFKSLSLLKTIGACWFACFQFGLIVFPIVNLLYWIVSLFAVPGEQFVIIAGFIVFLLFLSYIGIGLYNAYQPIVKTYQFQVPRKNAKRRSLRLAIASDMHFGGLSGKNHARRLVRSINKINADLVLFPGDLVDDDPDVFKQKRMDRTLKQIRSKLGIYAVLGNHEYYGGKIKELTKIMKHINVHILQDESVLVDNSLQIIGRKDKTDRKRKTIDELQLSAGQSHPVLVLDHQPTDLEAIMKSGADILLSGHTHRGQIAPNQWITKKIFELDWGYKKKENLHVVVSSGFGFWGPPIRIGSRSEVVQIDVTFIDSP
ncbi:phosphoesterase [Salipaludibacillus keqinensis]|uniref:Phosphoesterase n=1 Tax=Salipaludibacillus keqinensis TaxID=2045207 RepID=A0A323U005_9BACI|nr:metallophosphoesterase [Salipaludibacillus keqinensis]PYZ95175.1 phosphoesterase [Salipaludibacillus keqinensis]